MNQEINNLFKLPSLLEPIDLSSFGVINKHVFVKRDDLIHPVVSGNKWRKLKCNVKEYFAGNYVGIVTFGGAHSNHILAMSYLAKFYGIPTIIFVRGEKPKMLNPTLKKCYELGVELTFISRETYKRVTTNEDSIKNKYLDYFIISEGGANSFGIKGCKDVVKEIDLDFDEIFCDVGTGATIAGIASELNSYQKVKGVVVLKGAEYLESEINNFLLNFKHRSTYELLHNYHFGGYARNNKELIAFMRKFYEITGIKTDPIYSGKMFYGLIEQLKNENDEKTIIALHSGGLQGIEGFEQRYNLKIYE
jgi:1-aminocyclopropane-1-carboxylate deaminase